MKSTSAEMLNAAGKAYGDILREYRKKKGMSQEQVGLIAGVKKNAVGAWEAGRSRPDVASIPALCKALELPLNVFFGLSDENREGRWVWDDGTEDTLRLWSVKYGVQQPDNGNGYAVEHYAEFDYDRFNPEGSDNTGNWNDAEYLKNTSTFLCEWDYVLKGL